MDGNLFASILDSNKQISQQIGELGVDYVGNVVSSTLRNWGATASDVSLSRRKRNTFCSITYGPRNCSTLQYFSTDQSISVSITETEERQETFMLVPTKFIVYMFTFIRHSDGESHTVGRRYKELSAWYQDVSIIRTLMFDYFNIILGEPM